MTTKYRTLPAVTTKRHQNQEAYGAEIEAMMFERAVEIAKGRQSGAVVSLDYMQAETEITEQMAQDAYDNAYDGEEFPQADPGLITEEPEAEAEAEPVTLFSYAEGLALMDASDARLAEAEAEGRVEPAVSMDEVVDHIAAQRDEEREAEEQAPEATEPKAPKARKGGKQWNEHGIAGCVRRRTARASGQPVGLYHAAQAGIAWNGTWVVRCDTHLATKAVANIEDGKYAMTTVDHWCPECKALAEAKGSESK